MVCVESETDPYYTIGETHNKQVLPVLCDDQLNTLFTCDIQAELLSLVTYQSILCNCYIETCKVIFNKLSVQHFKITKQKSKFKFKY